MKIIPMAPDVAQIIGDAAEKVENPSLLLDRFVTPKHWVELNTKLDEANRWSMLRIAKHGQRILEEELGKARRGENKNGKVGENARAALKVLPNYPKSLSQPQDIGDLRKAHTRNLIQLLDSADSRSIHARLLSRLAINLSDGLIQNAGICLDRIFGAPYIPGSAVKGNARHAALSELRNTSDSVKQAQLLQRFILVFGCMKGEFSKQDKGLAKFNAEGKVEPCDQKGLISFLPAHPVGSADLAVDITNVHAPEYYTGGKDFPAGSPRGLKEEKPRPNTFPVVEEGAEFLFPITLNTTGKRHKEHDILLSEAERWLSIALTESGIGAKTAAGYGWFELVEQNTKVSKSDHTCATSEALNTYTEASFQNACQMAFDAGQRQKFMSLHLDKIQLEENKNWLSQFIVEAEKQNGKAIKKMRKTDWYLKLKERVGDESK